MKKTMRVNLIIGGAGFLGRSLADYLEKKGEKVVSTFKTEKSGLKETKNLSFLSCDATREEDIRKVIGACAPDRVFYLAAQGSVRKAWEDVVGTTAVNFIGGLYALEAIRRLKLDSKFVIFSSGVAYGETHKPGVKLKEEACLRPKDPYGLSKLAVDFSGKMYAKAFGTNTLMLRFVNIVGERQSAKFSLANFAYHIAGIEKGRMKPVLKVGNLSSWRDYLDVRDALRAIDLALDKGGKGEVYNVASGISRHLNDILSEMISLAEIRRAKLKIERDPELNQKDEIPTMCLDSRKLRKATGWKPEIPFRRTLTDILNYWRNYWDEN